MGYGWGGRMAMTRVGAPLPPWIFIGSAIRPRGSEAVMKCHLIAAYWLIDTSVEKTAWQRRLGTFPS